MHFLNKACINSFLARCPYSPLTLGSLQCPHESAGAWGLSSNQERHRCKPNILWVFVHGGCRYSCGHPVTKSSRLCVRIELISTSLLLLTRPSFYSISCFTPSNSLSTPDFFFFCLPNRFSHLFPPLFYFIFYSYCLWPSQTRSFTAHVRIVGTTPGTDPGRDRARGAAGSRGVRSGCERREAVKYVEGIASGK